jgi:hypothetical protein
MEYKVVAVSYVPQFVVNIFAAVEMVQRMRVVVVKCAAPSDSDIVSDSDRRAADESAGSDI